MARSSGEQDQARGAAERGRGRLKEAFGALSGNRSQANRGRTEQARGGVRERWGHVKDAFRR